jgi:hypothetical protein
VTRYTGYLHSKIINHAINEMSMGFLLGVRVPSTSKINFFMN